MVVPTSILTNIKGASLGEFDTCSDIGFGDDNTTPLPTDTTLSNEIIRKSFDETPTKNISSGTYDFSATIGLTEGNSTTYEEVGLFNASSGGDMFIRKLLSSSVTKTSSIELSVGLRLNIEVTNT